MRHELRLKKNYRMALRVKNLAHKNFGEKAAIRRRANELRATFQ